MKQKISRESALEYFENLAEHFRDLKPCINCGRVFLAGSCCENPSFPMTEDRRRELEEDDPNFEK